MPDPGSIAIRVTGVGRRRARDVRVALNAVTPPDRPALMVMAGVAGALDPTLAIGDVVVADRVVTEGGASAAPPILQHPTKARVGALLSLDRVLVTAVQKTEAYDGFGRPLAVEMETAGVIDAAREFGIPWLAVRAISDTADESLSLDFNCLRTRDGDLHPSRVALAALSRPSAIPGLLRLGRNTALATDRLAAFLVEWMGETGGVGGRTGDA